jgi:hypothetical protein
VARLRTHLSTLALIASPVLILIIDFGRRWAP